MDDIKKIGDAHKERMLTLAVNACFIKSLIKPFKVLFYTKRTIWFKKKIVVSVSLYFWWFKV
jgi:hypothetical protein